MPANSTSENDKDDTLTLIAISAVACIIQDVAHEGLGHAGVAWASGARLIAVSTVAEHSDIGSKWISAGGTLVNLLSAVIFWLLLVNLPRTKPATRYFLVLSLTASLFTGTGYFFFSGVTNFGDWAAVIQGLEPHWVWRLALILLGALSYYASMLVVASQLRPFERSGYRSRLRKLCWLPYFTDGVLAFLAGLFNPLGLFYVVASALPSTLGANAGLLSLPSLMRRVRVSTAEPVGPIFRSLTWIISAAVASALFILVLGRGLSWSR